MLKGIKRYSCYIFLLIMYAIINRKLIFYQNSDIVDGNLFYFLWYESSFEVLKAPFVWIQIHFNSFLCPSLQNAALQTNKNVLCTFLQTTLG